MKIVFGVAICLISACANTFAQNDQHLKFYATCDSIKQFVDNRYDGYDADLRGKMTIALLKKSMPEFNAVNNYIPLAVLPQVSQPQAQYLQEKYGLSTYQATSSVLTDYRTQILDSICYKNVLARFGKDVFIEMPPALVQVKQVKQEVVKPIEQPKTAPSLKATTAPKVSETQKQQQPITTDATSITLPTINRVTDVSEYLKRKLALDASKIESGDFIILVFDKNGRLADAKVISVDIPEDGEPERLTPYLKTQAVKIKALIRKFGWRGPTQNGKYVAGKVVVSLSDWSVRML
jgi:hypothetical protein